MLQRLCACTYLQWLSYSVTLKLPEYKSVNTYGVGGKEQHSTKQIRCLQNKVQLLYKIKLMPFHKKPLIPRFRAMDTEYQDLTLYLLLFPNFQSFLFLA